MRRGRPKEPRASSPRQPRKLAGKRGGSGGATAPGASTPRANPPILSLEQEPALPLEPLTPAWMLKTLAELRVPTVALSAEILTIDGRSAKGRIFVPASAHNHQGTMRADEWMNAPSDFFGFLADGTPAPVLLNREEVLVMTVAAHANAGDLPEEAGLPERRVVIDCGGRRFEGSVVIDMPEDQRRVLDYLNRPRRFLTLRDRDRHHLVQRKRITRVQET